MSEQITAPVFEVGQQLFVVQALGFVEEATLVGVEKATPGIRRFRPDFELGEDIYVVRYTKDVGDNDRIYGSYPHERIFKTREEAYGVSLRAARAAVTRHLQLYADSKRARKHARFWTSRRPSRKLRPN